MAYATYKEAYQKIAEFGAVTINDRGMPVRSPYLIVANQAFAQMVKLLSAFGMTPADRARVQALPETNPKDDWSMI